MTDDDLNELRGDYMTQLRHVQFLERELETERDKLNSLEESITAEQNRRQSKLENYIGALGSTSTASQEKSSG